MKTIAYVKARDLIFGKKIEKRADGMVYIVEVSRKEIRKLIKLEKMFEVKSLEYSPHDIYFIEHKGANYEVRFKIPIVKEPDESKMKDKTFELAERLADEAFESKEVAVFSNRQELTSKFYEMLKSSSAEFYSKAVICAERYKQAAKAEEDLTAAFEALVKNHNEQERTIK